jgi:hypothetical protein
MVGAPVLSAGPQGVGRSPNIGAGATAVVVVGSTVVVVAIVVATVVAMVSTLPSLPEHPMTTELTSATTQR